MKTAPIAATCILDEKTYLIVGVIENPEEEQVRVDLMLHQDERGRSSEWFKDFSPRELSLLKEAIVLAYDRWQDAIMEAHEKGRGEGRAEAKRRSDGDEQLVRAGMEWDR